MTPQPFTLTGEQAQSLADAGVDVNAIAKLDPARVFQLLQTLLAILQQIWPAGPK